MKTIVRKDRVSVISNPHLARYTKAFKAVDIDGATDEGIFNDQMPTNHLAINHYHTKSLEEYKLRCKCRRADIKGIQGKGTYTQCKPEIDILAS